VILPFPQVGASPTSVLQFAADAPALILVEGTGMEDKPGCSESQWIEIVCQWVLLHAGAHADTLFDIANQNMSLYCHEHVLRAFGKGGYLAAKQAGDHAISLDADSSSVSISFASSFLLQEAGASSAIFDFDMKCSGISRVFL
jgi:hypothetical protein